MSEITLRMCTLDRNVSTAKKNTKGAKNTVAVKNNLTDDVGMIIINTFITFISSMMKQFIIFDVRRTKFL